MRVEEQTGEGAAPDAGYPSSWDEVVVPPAGRRQWKGKQRWASSKAWDLRERLRKVMGGKCVKCGSTEQLEFHHPRGRTWVARRKNQLQRMKLYWRDFMEGVLELLCSPCNKKVGDPNTGYWQRSKARRKGRR
jgi:hypothetical protein